MRLVVGGTSTHLGGHLAAIGPIRFGLRQLFGTLMSVNAETSPCRRVRRIRRQRHSTRENETGGGNSWRAIDKQHGGSRTGVSRRRKRSIVDTIDYQSHWSCPRAPSDGIVVPTNGVRYKIYYITALPVVHGRKNAH